MAPSRNCYLFHSFIIFLSTIPLLLEGTRIHLFQSLWIRGSFHMLTWLRRTHWFMSVFTAYFVCYIRVPGTAGYRFCSRVNQIRPTKSCSCLIFFVKVASGRSLVIRLYYKKWQHTKKKKKDSIGFITRLPIGDRKRLGFVRFLF